MSELESAPKHCWDDVLGDDERLAAGGYTASRQVRGSRALLMVDLYNRVFGDGPAPLAEAIVLEPSSCGLPAWDALPALATLLETARRSGTPVIHTIANEVDASFGDPTLRSATLGDQADSAGHPPGWGNTIIDPLTPLKDELVLEKHRASAFFGTTLDTYLRMIGVDALVVAGESTSGCVRATVVDAYSLGFNVVIAEEGTFDRSPLSHKVSLFDMHCKYATVVHVEEAVALLSDSQPATLQVV